MYKRAFKDYNISKENINILKDTIDDYQALVDKWDKAVMEGIKHQNARAAVKDNTNQKAKVQNEDREAEKLTYKVLIKKPDIKVDVISSKVYSRADTVFYAKENAAQIGKRNNKNEVSVYVDDLGKDVVLATDGLKHSLNRNLDVISPVTVNIGAILKNSIVINELIPKNKNASNTYVLIGITKFANGEPIIVRSIVNEFDNSLQSIETLYAVNAKKESAATASPRFANDSLSVTDSTISIADLLDYVNKYYPDILPQNVLNHFGRDNRPESELSGSVKYQDRERLTTEDELITRAGDFDILYSDDEDLFEDEENTLGFESPRVT